MTQIKLNISDAPKSVNPYETPSNSSEFSATPCLDAKTNSIQQIANCLRQVNIVVFLYFCILPINMLFVTAGEKFPFEGLSLVAIPFLIFGFGGFAVYNLAVLLRGKTFATLCAIGLLVPLLGFLVLLSVRHLGVSELRKS